MIDFEQELQCLLNRYSQEEKSNTPDFMLATYLQRCLAAFNEATNNRDCWYGVHLEPGYKYSKAKEPPQEVGDEPR